LSRENQFQVRRKTGCRKQKTGDTKHENTKAGKHEKNREKECPISNAEGMKSQTFELERF
jgi:hypothetical protein